jgi:hypothetical protein
MEHPSGMTLTDGDLSAIEAEYRRLLTNKLARDLFDAEQAEDDEAASWTREDLTAFLDDDDEDFLPTVLEREDGAALFYTGLNMIFGDSGSGKSMVMAATVAQQLVGGQIVAWIDYEEVKPKTLIKRLRKLGVPREVIDAGLWWKHSDEALTKRRLAKMAAEALEMAGEERTVGLLVIDSVGEALGAEGLNEDKDSDTGPWMNRVRTVLPLLPDAAVVVVDHSTKAKDGPGRLHPSGSKRKRAALTGVAWLTETVEEFSKQTAGAVQLVCAKDRHGNFRRGDVGALVRVTPKAPAASESGHGGLEIRICAPPGGAGCQHRHVARDGRGPPGDQEEPRREHEPDREGAQRSRQRGQAGSPEPAGPARCRRPEEEGQRSPAHRYPGADARRFRVREGSVVKARTPPGDPFFDLAPPKGGGRVRRGQGIEAGESTSPGEVKRPPIEALTGTSPEFARRGPDLAGEARKRAPRPARSSHPERTPE